METKTNTYKMKNKNVKFENDGDVINGNSIKIFNYYDNREIYEILTKKDNYLEFYKKYLLKFQELKEYAFSLFYPQLKRKSYEFTGKTLIMGKKIIDWIYGLNNFPNKEIKEFYKELKFDFEFNDDTVIVKRWKANIDYFNNNLKQACDNYDKLYDELTANKNVPDWYMDDICIDGRNLLIQYENIYNKYSINNKFQKKINSNKYKLHYPDIDRIKSEIFEKVSEHIFNNKNASKYTTIYGMGLEECFEQIQNLIYLTIFYGSITHLKLIRKLISGIMYMYADAFEDEDFYKLTLRMLFLSGEFKKYRNLYDKIKLKYSFVISKDFIESIVESRKALFEFESNRNNIFLYDIYGTYIDDDLYKKLESYIFDIITIKDNYQISIISYAFKSIASNVKRLNRISTLLEIIKKYFDESYSKFYVDIGRILNSIDVDNLTENEFLDYQIVVDLLIKEKEYLNYDLSKCIIAIKKRNPKINKYDSLIDKAETNENIIYQVELGDNEFETIKNIVKIYKERYDERTSGLFRQYTVDYEIGIKVFTKDVYKNEIKSFFINEYLPLAKDIILSKDEDIYEKNRHIKLLAQLMMIEDDKKILEDIIDTICKAKKTKSANMHYIGVAKARNQLDLNINIMMCDAIVHNITYDQVLCDYIEIAIKHHENIEEILDCVSRLNTFFKNKDECTIDKLYFLFTIAYQENDIDIRNDVVVISKIFIGTKYEKRIIEILEKRIENICLEEAIGYIQLIMDSKNKDIYNTIIQKLKNNCNYYVKYMTNKYL